MVRIRTAVFNGFREEKVDVVCDRKTESVRGHMTASRPVKPIDLYEEEMFIALIVKDIYIVGC